MFIPIEEKNRDYRKYLAWVAEGNSPPAADPIPISNGSAENRAAQLLLRLANPSDPADIDEKNSLLRELGGS